MNDLRLSIRRTLIVLYKRTARDGQCAVVENDSRKSLGSAFFQRKCTAADIQHTRIFILDRVKTAGVCTARNRERAVVVQHGRAGVARGGGQHIKGSCAVVLNRVVACTTDDAAVLHGCGRARGNRQRCLACARVRQRIAAEVERDVPRYRHILGGIAEQRDRVAVRRICNSFSERCVGGTADFRNIAGRECRQRERSQQHAERERDRQKLVCLHCFFFLSYFIPSPPQKTAGKRIELFQLRERVFACRNAKTTQTVQRNSRFVQRILKINLFCFVLHVYSE